MEFVLPALLLMGVVWFLIWLVAAVSRALRSLERIAIATEQLAQTQRAVPGGDV